MRKKVLKKLKCFDQQIIWKKTFLFNTTLNWLKIFGQICTDYVKIYLWLVKIFNVGPAKKNIFLTTIYGLCFSHNLHTTDFNSCLDLFCSALQVLLFLHLYCIFWALQMGVDKHQSALQPTPGASFRNFRTLNDW